MTSVPTGARSGWPIQIGALVGFGSATALVAWLGSLATRASSESAWFEQLEKPPFYPPDATFGIVWSILYVLVAIAGWMAWRSGGGWRAAIPWAVQIVLNLGWTILFFGLESPGWAMAEIVLLLAATVWAARAFARFEKWATALFVPYILWVAFAAALNASILVLN